MPYTPMPYYYYQQPPQQGPRPDEYNLPPPPPRRYNSAGMVAGGVVILTKNITTIITNSILISTAANRIDIYCDSPSFPCAHTDDATRKSAGIVFMAGGALLAAAGVPLWLIGARQVPLSAPPAGTPVAPGAPAQPPHASLPEVRVGLGTASVTVHF